MTQCDQCCSVEDGWRMSWDHCSVLTPQLQSLVSQTTGNTDTITRFDCRILRLEFSCLNYFTRKCYCQVGDEGIELVEGIVN